MPPSRQHRRKPQQQATDILKVLLHDQEAKAQRLYDAYDLAEAEAVKTRRAIEALGMEPLPGFEGLAMPDLAEIAAHHHAAETAMPATEGYGQRIGEKMDRCPVCGRKRPWHEDGCTEIAQKEHA